MAVWINQQDDRWQPVATKGCLGGGFKWVETKQQKNHLVVATQIFFMFIPKIGEMIKFDEHIFQKGWNHQLGCDLTSTLRKIWSNSVATSHARDDLGPPKRVAKKEGKILLISGKSRLVKNDNLARKKDKHIFLYPRHPNTSSEDVLGIF